MKKAFLTLFFWLFLLPLRANPFLFSLEGYLEKIQLSSVEDTLLSHLSHENGIDALVLRVASSGGDLEAVIAFAKMLMEVKKRYHLPLTVYIDHIAVGPGAIFPFLSDTLYVTSSVAWGDVIYGVAPPPNLDSLRAVFDDVLNADRIHAATLKQLSEAMIDPSVVLVSQLALESGHDQVDRFIANLSQLQQLNLVDNVVEEKDFQAAIRQEDAFQKKFFHSVQVHEKGNNNIGYLSIGIDHPINQATYIYVKFALEEYLKRKACFVLLDLNTPGGEVLSTIKIIQLLHKWDQEHHIPTLAFINDWAISAGAMLAYGCRFIGSTPSSIMGAAEPVVSDGTSMQSASEKVNSALRAEMANLASFYHRDPLIAEAMVDKDILLVLRDKKIVRLDGQEALVLTGPNKDTVISGQGKLLTLSAKELIDFKVSDFSVVDQALPTITQAEREQNRWPAKKMLAFTNPVLAKIPNAIILNYVNWKVTFFTFLSHPLVSALLLIGLIVGAYLEIHTPGFGVMGSFAILCLALILVSSFSVYAAGSLEILALLAGALFIALEIFVIPGFGFVGIIGIFITLLGLFALLLPGIRGLSAPSWDLIAQGWLMRLAYLALGVIIAAAFLVLFSRFGSKRLLTWSKIVLTKEPSVEKARPLQEKMPRLKSEGVTLTPLYPFGRVEIEGQTFDAVSLGGFIEANENVEVLRIEGNKLIVKKIKE